MTTVGNGKYTYEQVENWEKLPEGWELGQTAIVTDPEDRVYLFNRGEHPLIVLDRDGNYLASWGEGVLTDAHGMFIDDDQNLYMPVKNSHVVLKYDPKGNLLMTMGEWGKPSDTGWSGNYSDPAVRAAGPFNSPSDIAISPDGLLYISDGYGNARVHRFTARRRIGGFLGHAGEDRSRRIPRPARGLGAHRRASVRGRPREQPHADLRLRGQLPGAVAGPGATLRHLHRRRLWRCTCRSWTVS